MERKKIILTTPGVYTIACFGSEPAKIPGLLIQTIRRALDSSLPIRPRPFVSEELIFKQQIIVRKGPLADAIGMIEHRSSTCELIVSIELIAKSVAIEIDASWLDFASGNADNRAVDSTVEPILAREPSII